MMIYLKINIKPWGQINIMIASISQTYMWPGIFPNIYSHTISFKIILTLNIFYLPILTGYLCWACKHLKNLQACIAFEKLVKCRGNDK